MARLAGAEGQHCWPRVFVVDAATRLFLLGEFVRALSRLSLMRIGEPDELKDYPDSSMTVAALGQRERKKDQSPW